MMKFKKVLLFAMLLLAVVAAQAANYDFSDTSINLPAGCSKVSTGNYACGTLSLAAGESITIGATATTITFSGAFDTGGGVMINNGIGSSTSNLTMVVNGAATLGTGSTLNGNLTTLGAGAVSIAVGSWVSGNVSTELGFVAMGAATTPTGVGGSIRTITGYVGLGAGAYVGGPVSTDTGYVSLGAGATINGAVTTTTAGDVGLGAGAILNGDIMTKGAGSVILGASSWAKGSITVQGTTGADYITTADSSKVNCNISGAGSYITLGAKTQVGGSVTAKDYVTVGAGVFIAGNVTSTENYVVVGDGSTVRGKVVFKTSVTIDAGSHVYYEVVDTSACGSPANAARFECLASASALPARLFTKLAGTSFAFDVMAIKADGTKEDNFVAGSSTKSVTLELVDGTGSSATDCASRAALSPAVSQGLSFSATDAGRKSASMTVNNAYANLRCRVTDANQTPSVVACSSDNFSVRPTGLNVTSSANADLAGTSASATPAIKAGANFTLTAASNTVGYNAAPQLNASKVVAHVGAVQSGTLAGSFSSADPATGTATGTAFSYGEVGYFKLDANGIYDDVFTAVDSAQSDCTPDFSNNLVGGKYGCKFGNAAPTSSFGRFYPDHFDLTPNVDLTPNFVPGCTLGGFTYMDQPFKLNYTVIAKSMTSTSPNSLGTVLKNYTGGQVNLVAMDGLTDLTTRLVPLVPLPSWKDGSYIVTALSAFSRPGSVVADATWGPFDALNIGVAVDDADGVGYAAAISTFEGATPASCTKSGTTACRKYASLTGGETTKMRLGRIKLSNTYGSERMPLKMPLAFEYWTSNGWQKNGLDTCTPSLPWFPLLSSNFAVAFPVGTKAKPNNLALAPCDSALTVTVSSAPAYVLSLSKPGSGKTGWADVTLNLGAVALGQKTTCITAGSVGGEDVPAILPWLQYNGNNPSARATFGIFKSPLIYRRENY